MSQWDEEINSIFRFENPAIRRSTPRAVAPSPEMDSESPAPFSMADIKFIQGFEDNLRRDIAIGHDYGGLLEALSNRLKAFREFGINESPWGPVKLIQDVGSSADKQSMIRINGPFPGDYFEVMMHSSHDASKVVHYMSALNAASKKLEEIRVRALAVIQRRRELEKEQQSLSQPAEVTVDDHIRLLRQYNKTKDVGQQLIGLIAESRGIPLGTVYKDGEYGVCAED